MPNKHPKRFHDLYNIDRLGKGKRIIIISSRKRKNEDNI